MKTVYFDCFSGISGDMSLGSLLACGVSADNLRSELNKLNIPGWSMVVNSVARNGIGAMDVQFILPQEEGHGRHLHHIQQILDNSALTESVKARALRVFQNLAQAEATVHQTTPENIHFHEVGALDAILDIVGFCICLELLDIKQVVCSPLPLGNGFVECAHGIIPLPAPAVLELTKGFPVKDAGIEGETVTPTGAALMVSLADSFGALPPMTVMAVGYGAGKNDFGSRPNLVRAVIGRSEDYETKPSTDAIQLETNIDDMSPQLYSNLMRKLFNAGALDVFLTPIQMKKNRPGILLQVLCPEGLMNECAKLIFHETSTLGIRYQRINRLCLERSWHKVSTHWGDVRMKVAQLEGNEVKASPEYEDLKSLADTHDISVREVQEAAVAAWHAYKGK
jgi:uncharacterized protein (TIGR00299 family) protein